MTRAERHFVVVGIKPHAAVGDAALAFDVGCFDDDQRGAGIGQHAEMHQVPVIGAAIVGGILAHRRDDDAVGKLETGQPDRARTKHWSWGNYSLRGLTLLDRLQIGNDGTDVIGFKREFRHIRVAGHDALAQRLFERLDRIARAQRAESRCVLRGELPVRPTAWQDPQFFVTRLRRA